MRRARAGMLVVAAAGTLAAALMAGAVQPEPKAGEGRSARRQILLADTTRVPTVVVSWPTRDGKTVTLEGERKYKSPGEKALLGKNIEAYVALGGTRLEKGRGHPEGAIVRAGLYKVDTAKLFFENIAENADVSVTVRGIKMNQPAAPVQETGLMHLRYMLSDLAACGIDSSGRNLIATVSAEDPIKGAVGADSARLGALDGKEGNGSVSASVGADGLATVTFTFPYPLLRHVKDPYQRTVPGGFFEPQHFHVEMEFLPVKAGE